MTGKKTRDLVEMMDVIGGNDPARRARLEALKEQHRLLRQLSAARRKSGLTQAELARRMGISPSTVARLERGESASPNLALVQQMALALGLQLDIRLRTRRKEA